MRIDLFLYTNGYCSSRTKASQLIAEGVVCADGKAVTKPSFEVTDTMKIEVLENSLSKYVGRGALKLQHALEVFEVDASNKICADIGASTGGFTQCLLNAGACKVYAIDSGTDQLAEQLKNDSRVVSMENTNARYITSEDLGQKVSLTVMDVSFISQTLLYPAILQISQPPCDVITLVKPQFETQNRRALGKHGVIRDDKERKKALQHVIEQAELFGFKVVNQTDSPITGGSGNMEYLLHLKLEQ